MPSSERAGDCGVVRLVLVLVRRLGGEVLAVGEGEEEKEGAILHASATEQLEMGLVWYCTAVQST